MVLSPVCKIGGGCCSPLCGDATSSKSFGVHTIQSGWNFMGDFKPIMLNCDMLDLNRFNPPYNVRSGTRIRIPCSTDMMMFKRWYIVSGIADVWWQQPIWRGWMVWRVICFWLGAVTSFAWSAEEFRFSFFRCGCKIQCEKFACGISSRCRSSGFCSVRKTWTCSLSQTRSDSCQKFLPVLSPDKSGQSFLISPVSGRVVSSFGAKRWVA